jgi:hypothetical protein
MICIAMCIGLLLIGAAGCKNESSTTSTTMKIIYTTPPETTIDFIDKTAAELLSVDLESVLSLKIVRMGDGKAVVIEDKEQIGRILVRLGQVKFNKDLGKHGFSPDGYSLKFEMKDNPGEYQVGISVDSAQHSNISTYNSHFYEIVEEGNAEYFNDYFYKEMYKQQQ